MSALSDVQICNLALDSIGTRSTIASLQENSKEARACARQYLPTLEAVLSAAHWNFARKQVALALLKDGTKNPPDAVPQPWVYEYAWPADCVRARFIMPLLQGNPGVVPGSQALPFWMGPPVRWLVSSDVDAQGNAIKVILTNQGNAQLVYTTLITNTLMFDGQFVRAFANYLGHLLAIPLSGDKTLAKQAFDMANATAIAARATNGNEGITVIDVVPDWMRVRGYISDWAYPPGAFFTQQPQALTQIS
jgi:hypothetical protein